MVQKLTIKCNAIKMIIMYHYFTLTSLFSLSSKFSKHYFINRTSFSLVDPLCSRTLAVGYSVISNV